MLEEAKNCELRKEGGMWQEGKCRRNRRKNNPSDREIAGCLEIGTALLSCQCLALAHVRLCLGFASLSVKSKSQALCIESLRYCFCDLFPE